MNATSFSDLYSRSQRKSTSGPVPDDLTAFLKALKIQRGSEESVLPRLQEWEDGYQAQITRDFCAGIGITEVKFHDLPGPRNQFSVFVNWI